MHSRALATAAVLLVALGLLAATANAAVIKEIVPRLGSVHGMTRLSILGSGFDIRGRSNDVYIGTSIYGVFCDPIPNECHEGRIVCLTDPHHPVGRMPLSVRSFGHVAQCEASGGCHFEYTLARTPEVQTISPEWIVAPSMLTVTGQRFSQGDVSVGNFDFTMHLGEEERCNLNLGQVSSTSFACEVEPMRPGSLRVDIQMGAFGRASVPPDAVVHLFPSITGVSPASGSIDGGQTVTVFGTSFSPDLADNFVSLHGSPCTVTRYDNEFIECVTHPHAATAAPPASFELGKIRMDWWFNVPGSSLGADLFNRLNYLFPTGTTNVTSMTSDTIIPCDHCAFQWTTHLIAHESGTYLFEGNGAVNYELWLSLDETPVLRQRDLSNSGNPADVAEFHPRRILRGTTNVRSSRNVTLEAGHRYWIRGLLKDSTANEFIDFWVTLPNGTRTRISSGFVAYRPDWKPPVEVYVRDTPALLGEECFAWGSCSFDYTAAATPTVTAIQPASVTPGGLVTITGTKFSTAGVAPSGTGSCIIEGCGGGGCECPSNDECALFDDVCQWNVETGKCAHITPLTCHGFSTNMVLINGKPCDITSASATEIICRVPETAGGFHEAEVIVDGRGRALGQVFVTIEPSIRAISPTSGSINGKNTLRILGSGYDVAENVTTVTVGGASCEVGSVSTFDIRCTIPAGVEGAAEVSVTTKTHLSAVSRAAYTYVGDFVRPGTTVVDDTLRMAPTSGSTAGGTEVTIVLPSTVRVGLSGTRVRFGNADCAIRTALGREVRCITGPSAVWGPATGTLEYLNKFGAVVSRSIPSFVYFRSVTWVREELISPHGGRWNTINFDATVATPQTLSIAIEGQPCSSISYGTGSVECLVAPRPTSLPETPLIDLFHFNGDGNQFTNKLARVDYSSNVVANADGTVTIPRGGYVNTRRSYARPFVFTAKVKATRTLSDGGGAIPIRVLVDEPTLSWSGVRGIAAARNNGRFGFSIDQWNRLTSGSEFEGEFSSVGLDATTFRTYRMEVWNKYVNFYIDETLIFSAPVGNRPAGSVGIGFADQDIIVDDFEIRSLYPRALQVNVSGVPLRSNFDVIYSEESLPRVTRITPSTTVRGGQTITLQGSNFRGQGHLRVFALTSASEQVTRHTHVLCSGGSTQQNILTEEWEMTCTVNNNVPAGNYFFLVANRRGAAASSVAGVVSAALASISPRFGSGAGVRLTTIGSGFSESAVIKVGSADCTVVARNLVSIVCDTGVISGQVAVSVVQGSTTLRCATAANCNFNANLTTGVVESIEPTSGGEGTTVTFTGRNFTRVSNALVGTRNAHSCSRSSATRITCRMGRQLSAGSFPVRLFSSDGYIASDEAISFTYVSAATWRQPEAGSPIGGTELRVYGTVLDTSIGTSNVANKVFTSSEDGWSASSIFTCYAGSMLGRFSPEEEVSRTFTGLETHTAVRVSFRFLTSNPTPTVQVDGVTYVATYAECVSDNSCGAPSDNNCYFEGSVVIPHTAGAAKVTFATRNNANGWWGLMSYRFDTIATVAHAVTVAGSPCALRWMDHENIFCVAPAGTSESAPLRVTVNGETMCQWCNFKYTADAQPTAQVATFAHIAGISSANTDVPLFAEDSNVEVTYSASGATVRKVSGGNSWNAGAFAPRPLLKTDGSTVGVEFTVDDASNLYMVGLGVEGAQSTSAHWDITYAVYINNGRYFVQEFGKYMGHPSSVRSGDRAGVVYSEACDCIQYTLNGVPIFTSTLAPTFPLFADLSIHRSGAVIRDIRLVAPQAAADRLVFAGRGIVPDLRATVTITGKTCLGTYSTEGRVSCWVAAGSVSAGDELSVTIINRNGNGAPSTVTASGAVTGISHSSGSRSGFHRVTITGGTFGETTAVSFSAAGTCNVVSVSSSAVVCDTPAVAGEMEVPVVVSNGATALPCISSTALEGAETTVGCDAIKYSYADERTPSITSVSPSSASSGATLTFLGENFVAVAESADAAVRPRIPVGSGSCEVVSSTATQLLCILANADAGEYTSIAITFPQRGRSNTVSLTVPLTITALSTEAAGNLGGATLLITGSGFGAADSTVSASVQVDSTDLCVSISRADTTITCVTKAGDFNGNVVVSVGSVSQTSSASFVASSANLAAVTGISPPTGGTGALLTLSGTNLGDATVNVGSAPCVVQSASATAITCVVGANVGTGVQDLTVTTRQRGVVSVDGVSFTAVMAIGSIRPTQGPKEGGQEVTIVGSGFGSHEMTRVLVGGSPCAIREIDAGTIKCTTGPLVDTDNHDVVVEYTDPTTTVITSPTQYTYDDALTATITSITPAAASASGEQLVTIAGTGFSIDTLKNRVTLGGAACDVESVAADGTSIVCRTRPHAPAADVPVVVVIANQGGATNDGPTTFSYELQIDSIAGGTEYSTEGGIALTLVGKGFWEIPNEESWKYRRYELTVGGLACPLISSTPTQIICMLGASPRESVNIPPMVNEYPARPDRTVGVALRGNGIAAAVASGVEVTFKAAATPTITSVSPVKGTIINKGATLTIAGSGFAASGNEVRVGAATCDITAESATEIVCSLNNGVIGRGFVQVVVPGKGLAFTQQSCPAGEFLLCDGSCIKNSDCVYEEWGMYNCGELTNLIFHDTFCHSNGGTDRVNRPFRTDSGVALALNCPMYSCEGQDCNTTITIGGHGGRISTCGADPNGVFLEYRARVTDATPKASSIGGGRRITITGTSFGTDVNAVQAFVGDLMCIPMVVSDTEIQCITTAAASAATGQMLRVAVKGVPASCTVCGGFSYDTTITPNVTGITPSGNAVAGQSMTIAGTGFGAEIADNAVSVGDAECEVTSASQTTIVCTTPNRMPGTHPVNVRVAGKGYASPAGSRTYQLTVNSLSQTVGSTEGGATIDVFTTGADATTRVVFGECTTRWVAFEAGKITVITNPCSGNLATRLVSGSTSTTRGSRNYNFADSATPKVSSFSASGNILSITVANMGTEVQTDVSVAVGDSACAITGFESGVITCTVPTAHAAGSFNIVTTAAARGAAKNDDGVSATFSYALSVGGIAPTTGSRGGNQLLTISGSNFDPNAANNRVMIGDAACVVESASHTEIVCRTGRTATASIVAPTVTIANPSIANAESPASGTATVSYAYDEDKTPIVTSVAPDRGSTAGGTRLTIGGQRLSKDHVVTVAGVLCTQSAAEQEMTDAEEGALLFCTTGAHTTMLEPELIRVATATDGDAYNTQAKYQYIDLWSRWTTWGNMPPPIEGDSAVISEGQTVMIDYSPPRFFLIIVMGHLLLDDTKDIELECTYIMINYGRFTVGTPEKPFHKRATIRLFGDRLTPEIPVHGSKVLALRHGALDMHGTPRQKTWTQITATAPVGASSIKISGPVDWKAGEFIVIASTDYEPLHAEERRIIGVAPADGQAAVVELLLESPLKFEHYGERQCYGDDGTQCIDEIAEVGLLTRNVVVEGDRHTARLGFGATLFLMPLGETSERYARLSYIELRDGGQQFIVGRYPVHYHVTHSSNNSYVNGTAVHRSLNRAFSIHGISNMTYVNNVAYDTHGHAFFIEDGSEKYNVITDNLAILARVSTSNLNTDLTPATYWIVSTLNYIARNHAGGSQAYGFWISPFHPHSTGPTFSRDICPASHQLWAFYDNVGHSNKKYGLNIFRFWWPKEVECDFNSPDAPATLRNVVVYKNNIWGVTLGNHESGEVGAIIFDNLTSADNGRVHPDAAAYWIEKNKARNMTCGVQNSLLIALTDNQPFHRATHRRGINLPEGDNFFTENVTFVNYEQENFAFEPQAWAERLSLCFPWGWEAVSRGLRWVNSPNRIRFRFHHHGVLNDDDGTLSGVAGSQIIPRAPIFDDDVCTAPTGFSTLTSSLVCPQDYKIRRFGVSTMNELWTDQRWQVEGRTEIVPEILRDYLMTAPINKEITVDHQWWFTASEWDWRYGGARFMRPDEKALFKVHYNETRHHVYGHFNNIPLNRTWNGSMPTLDETVSRYAFDNETMIFRGLLALPTQRMRVTAHDCPDEGCPLPELPPPAWEAPCGHFNDSAAWSSGEVPGNDTEVVVPYTDNICIGSATTPVPVCTDENRVIRYSFHRLRVEGGFVFTNDHCPCVGGEVIIHVETFVWVRNGGIMIGNETHPIKDCRIRFVLGTPPWNSENPQNMVPFRLNPWGFRSFTLESGTISMIGKRPEPQFTRLRAPAAAGDTTLQLERPVEWQVGDVVAIAGTNRELMYVEGRKRNGANDNEHSEHAKITAISADKRTLTLAAALRYPHHGEEPTTLNGVQYRIGAEVAVLSRHISIEGGHDDEEPEFFAGWRMNVGCTPGNFQGCATGARDGEIGWPMERGKPGYLKLDSVMLRDVGQGGVQHGALQIDGLTDGENDAGESYIRNLAMWRVYNTGISLRDTTKNLRVTNNTIYDVIGDGIRVAAPGNTLEGNLVMKVGVPEPNCEDVHFIFEDCRTSAYRLHPGTVVTRNIAASGVGAGFSTAGINCDFVLRWADNVAHSFRDGLLTYPGNTDSAWRFVANHETVPTTCRKVGGVMTYWTGDHGFVAWYADGNLEVENFISVDNAIGAAALTLHNGRFQDYVPYVKYTHVVFAGYFSGHRCRTNEFRYTCKSSLLNSMPWCQFFQGAAPHMGNIGLMESVFATDSYGIGKTKGEQKFRWTELDSYATAAGQALHSDIHFANFDGMDECQLKNAGFYQNPFSNDTFHHHAFEKVTWSNIEDGGHVWTRRTYGENRGFWYLDFDDIDHGGFWPDSPNKIWLADVDGSFTGTGKPSSILSSETITRNTQFRDLRWDGRAFQAGRLPPSRPGCTWKPEWNAFQCDETFEWFNLAIDSLADDELTRRAAPVVLCKGDGMIEVNGDPICQGGIVDYVSGPVMKGKVQRATLDRMSRWQFIAENGGNYTLSFRGQPPTHLRVRLQNHEYLQKGNNVGVTLNLRYFGENSASRVGVYVDGRRLRPNVGFNYPHLMVPPQTWPAPTDAAGTHFHDRFVDGSVMRETGQGYQRNVLSFVVRPGATVVLRQEPIIQLNMQVSIPEDEFFNNKETFVPAMAAVLGIEESRLRFAQIVPGTTRRRSGSGSTDIVAEVDLSAEQLEAFATTGVLPTGSFDGIADRAASLSNTVIGNVPVGEVTSRVVDVRNPRPELRIVRGTPFISMNVTRAGAVFNTTHMQQLTHAWILANIGPMGYPFNQTRLGDVALSNVFTDRETLWTQLVIVLAYENNNHTKIAMDHMFLLLNASSASLFPGWQIRDLFYSDNGWVPEGETVPPEEVVAMPEAPNNKIDQETLVKFAIGLAIGVAVVFIVGGSLMYYFVSVRPRRLAKEARARKLAMHEANASHEPKNPAQAMFASQAAAGGDTPSSEPVDDLV